MHCTLSVPMCAATAVDTTIIALSLARSILAHSLYHAASVRNRCFDVQIPQRVCAHRFPLHRDCQTECDSDSDSNSNRLSSTENVLLPASSRSTLHLSSRASLARLRRCDPCAAHLPHWSRLSTGEKRGRGEGECQMADELAHGQCACRVARCRFVQ